MGLKKLNYNDRITFLRRFTAEVMTNFIREQQSRRRVESEKMRQKLGQPETRPAAPTRTPSIAKRPAPTRAIPPPVRPRTPPRPMARPQRRPVRPQPKPPAGFKPGKIDPLIKDRSVQSIECPGPGKNILIKRLNQINSTRVILNQEEINDIINSFSRKARIPIVGGILKAAVDNLIISAVKSEFTGSRFIINKITPYSLLEK